MKRISKRNDLFKILIDYPFRYKKTLVAFIFNCFLFLNVSNGYLSKWKSTTGLEKSLSLSESEESYLRY
jgi:hypothetical protein